MLPGVLAHQSFDRKPPIKTGIYQIRFLSGVSSLKGVLELFNRPMFAGARMVTERQYIFEQHVPNHIKTTTNPLVLQAPIAHMATSGVQPGAYAVPTHALGTR